MYKLQKLILLQIGNIAKNLRLHERELWQLLDMTEPYLSTNQHPVLQVISISPPKSVVRKTQNLLFFFSLVAFNFTRRLRIATPTLFG